jgi:hypothetical protein
MSRSYKKFPHIRVWYGKSGKWGRKQANKKIRNLPLEERIPKGSIYKKYYNSYNIWDYSFTEFLEWKIEDYYRCEAHFLNGVTNYKKYDSLNEALIEWKKWYKCK